MLFRLCEHYSYENLLQNKLINKPLESLISENIIICFVCFEEKCNNENTIKLNNQYIFIKTCKCDGDIHKYCLKRWFNIKESCPICRSLMIKKPTILSGIFNNKFMHNFYLFYVRNYTSIVRLFFVLTIFYFIFEYTLLLDHIMYKAIKTKDFYYEDKINLDYFEEEINTLYQSNYINVSEDVNRIIPIE